MERVFERDIAELDRVFALMDEFSEAGALDTSVSFPVTMAVEELFTNMVKYNAAGGEIRIYCNADDASVEVRLVDTESDPFDVTADRGVDTTASLSERTPGGLGLHLIQRMMDEVHYSYKNRVTEIRLIKNR